MTTDPADRVAVVSGGRPFTYRALADAADRAAAALLDGRAELEEARVAFLVRPGVDYTATLLGIWRAGGVGVPLAVSHPPAELDYVIRDAEAAIVVGEDGHADDLELLARAAGARFLITASFQPCRSMPPPEQPFPDRRALMLYTSGTTGRPKGVVLSHGNISAQVTSLVTAWEWTGADRILLVLPLHHVHGIVNVVCCALRAGATCEMHERFDPSATWARLTSGDLSLFMAVPSIYYRLIQTWDAASADVREAWSAGAGRLRLMVSGSAALPVATLDRWRAITGHTLLERYGMTEIGMALSNSLHGERRPGFVGTPLPGVDVRLVDQAGNEVPAGTAGEIEVRGSGVFGEYWRRPEATRDAFRAGWFRTGDVAVVEGDAYRILGRTSVDIIKTGGYKVSALEIEEVLRSHPALAECAVVGVDDPAWGQRVSVAVELVPGASLSLEELQPWARVRLAPYKVPRALIVVDALPRNAMGKVLKLDVVALFVAHPSPAGAAS